MLLNQLKDFAKPFSWFTFEKERQWIPLSPITMNEFIAKINSYLVTQPVKKAWVFGSRSRGNHSMESDLDLLVELDYSQPIGLEFIQMKLDLEKLLGIKVDLVSAGGLSPLVKPYIEEEKKLIYAR